MTKEDKELLAKIKVQLRTALESDYARNIGSADMEKLKALWERMTGQRYPYNGSCSSCQLRLLKMVARWVKDHVELEPEVKINNLENKVANKKSK